MRLLIHVPPEGPQVRYPKEMADTELQVALRSALEELQAHLRSQIAELGVGSDGMPFDENFADSGQVAAEQGESRSLSNQLHDTLSEVERALVRLDEGTYGTCLQCEKAINEARLEAMPATPYCIDCASTPASR